MPAAATATSPTVSAPTPARKASVVPEKKYKCQFCNRAFSRSEHRSRHERSRKFLRAFRVVYLNRGVRGVDDGSWWGREITLATKLISIVAQTPKSDRSNVSSAAVPLSDEISFSVTIAPCTPKMEVSRYTARSSGDQAQSRHPDRLVLPNGPSSWTRQRWNK